ncbi:hypothetical protein QBC37DRAFT_488015 [Rhypophila decipiens]|uniref:Rhodopsin domain-containing protein n=1 Tax=Rhypophila decipiens TaxID=261697 RepID=A0AAN6XY28_9PEZI|nr:hypothetical protein QBC37DRAFT_488015 [Rhypophila decipiens]
MRLCALFEMRVLPPPGFSKEARYTHTPLRLARLPDMFVTSSVHSRAEQQLLATQQRRLVKEKQKLAGWGTDLAQQREILNAQKQELANLEKGLAEREQKLTGQEHRAKQQQRQQTQRLRKDKEDLATRRQQFIVQRKNLEEQGAAFHNHMRQEQLRLENQQRELDEQVKVVERMVEVAAQLPSLSLYVKGAIAVATDLTFAALSTKLLINVRQVELRQCQKITTILLMSCGIFFSGFVIAKLTYIGSLEFGKTGDQLFGTVNLAIWSVAEMLSGIIAACIPALQGKLKGLFQQLDSSISTGEKRTGVSSGHISVDDPRIESGSSLINLPSKESKMEIAGTSSEQ